MHKLSTSLPWRTLLMKRTHSAFDYEGKTPHISSADTKQHAAVSIKPTRDKDFTADNDQSRKMP